MAVDQLPVRLPRELPAPARSSLITLTAHRPAIASSRLLRRLLEIAPGGLAIFLISILTWGYVWIPNQVAIGLILFDLYWFWKSWTIGYHVLKGVRLMRHFKTRDWRAEYRFEQLAGRDVLPWDVIRHVVLIPNYYESVAKLRQSLIVMAATAGARDNVVPVLAMEDADPDAREKAAVLADEFHDCFADFLVTFHPYGLPGEVRGKSSNQAWAARCAVEELVGRHGHDLDHLTVTSCDADTQFPERYFECLTFMFATERNRYRRFWQAPIFFYNNIWQVPAPLRVTNAMSGMIHLSRLSRKRKVLFSQSTYSLSMRMAHDVGYWATDVIPEDWHMFLRCFYNLGGAVDVEPIHLPIGNDGALSRTTRATYVNQYLQVRRWAWGASDLPHFFLEAMRRREIPLLKRWLRFWYVFDNHITWSTQWFFITLGGLIPWLYDQVGGGQIMPDWLYVDKLIGTTFLPGWLTIPSLILTPCLIPYAIIIFQDLKLRPPAPPALTLTRKLFGLAHWALISPITFFFSALPALDSQIRLMLGRRMEYRVTEKV
jgi:hypothetical protein